MHRRRGARAWACATIIGSLFAGNGRAAETPAARGGDAAAVAPTVACLSVQSERRVCEADTAHGISLRRSVGRNECVLGETWGYDEHGIWVADGCAGEFELGLGTEPNEPTATRGEPTQPMVEQWGEFTPGDGFLVGRNSAGELSISAYALVRYIDQTPATQTFTDHLGNERAVDNRSDLYPHRAMVFLKGWVGLPKLVYNVFFWTVNATDQKGIFPTVGFQYSQKFSIYGGLNALPGTRSLHGSHPFWLGHDRVMADEYFRPYFTNGVWAQGELAPGLWYNAMIGNNLSALGVKASQLDRKTSSGASFWWMPTTKEFGPRGGFGDWEMHEELATRFGISMTDSPEERYTDGTTGATGNTTIRLADSLNVFDTGSLAPGVTVQTVDYRLLAMDAGFKYRGVFVQAELYRRTLDHFVADGLVPVGEIEDWGYYVQAAFFPVPRKIELYAATSQIHGDDSAGFGDSSEYLIGMNYYPASVRNHRFNVQVIDVNKSPASSSFGYYNGGHNGTALSAAFSVFF